MLRTPDYLQKIHQSNPQTKSREDENTTSHRNAPKIAPAAFCAKVDSRAVFGIISRHDAKLGLLRGCWWFAPSRKCSRMVLGAGFGFPGVGYRVGGIAHFAHKLRTRGTRLLSTVLRRLLSKVLSTVLRSASALMRTFCGREADTMRNRSTLSQHRRDTIGTSPGQVAGHNRDTVTQA